MTGVRRSSVTTLDAVLFATALVVYALGLPLGLARVEYAPQVTAGLALDGTGAPATFSLLAVRLVEYLPVGDVGLRANLASAGLAAVAVALFGRLGLRMALALRPPSTARQEAGDFAYEPLSVGAAALAFALSLAMFDAGTSAGPAAVTLALLALGLLVGLAVLRDWQSAPAGCGLAAIAGLAAGVDAVAGPLLWPLLLGSAIWGLRKGARWPLLAPLIFVAGWGGAALGAVACSVTPVSLASLFAPLGHLGAYVGGGLLGTALEVADQLGVVGALLVAIGLVALAVRSPMPVAWLLLTLVSSMMFVHPDRVAAGAGRAALPVVLGISSVFAAAGLIHVAGRFGRARAAATVTLAVMLLLTPALDGGRTRWLRRPPLAMALLDRALARAELRSVVDPGTDQVAGLFRLARAIGLRPDLIVAPHAGPAATHQH